MPSTSTQRTAPLASDDLRAQLERLHPESFGWARSCCRQEPEEAENVLQAVYLKIFEHKAVFDGKAAFRTWLFAVIRRTAAEARRRRFLQRLSLKRQREGYAPPAPPSSAEQTTYLAEVRTMFRSVLAALPRRQSEVLQLVFYHDLSLAEAAAVLGVSVGSARTHYERGKRRVRTAMTKAGAK
jgi:RNA polymerase sigma factor (sigma-70 family)